MRTASLVLTATLTAVLCSAAGAGTVVLHAARLYDGTGDTLRQNVSVVVEDGRIRAVEPGLAKVAGAEVIELGSATLAPGFIDCHVHLAAKLPSRTNATEDAVTHSDLDRAFEGAFYARAMQQQGFTTVRDLGGGDYMIPPDEYPLPPGVSLKAVR